MQEIVGGTPNEPEVDTVCCRKREIPMQLSVCSLVVASEYIWSHLDTSD